MKKATLIFAIVVAFAATSCSSYNNMVSKEEAVNVAWGNVQAQYQRRADLIPNLVNTVKGYAAHEQNTLDAVVAARAKATSINITADELTKENLAEFLNTQDEVRSALGRLIAVAENYPDLKANQNFLELQAQLEGTENRIAVARTQFNTAVKEYNISVRKFPANLFAMIFSFETKPYFEANGGSAQAPAVEF